MEPGKIIISDNYESWLPGRVFGNRGSKISSKFFKGGSIFCGSFSINISVNHQIKLVSEYNIMSKIQFERETMGEGVPVEI